MYFSNRFSINVFCNLPFMVIVNIVIMLIEYIIWLPLNTKM